MGWRPFGPRAKFFSLDSVFSCVYSDVFPFVLHFALFFLPWSCISSLFLHFPEFARCFVPFLVFHDLFSLHFAWLFPLFSATVKFRKGTGLSGRFFIRLGRADPSPRDDGILGGRGARRAESVVAGHPRAIFGPNFWESGDTQ